MILRVPIEFVLFGLTLLGIAIFHRRTTQISLIGLAAIALYKIAFVGFKTGPGLPGFGRHVHSEWVILVNLLCLLVGFAVLSRHFEKSHVPVVLARFLPRSWKGAFVLLVVVWILSSFLDNIAGALIGGAMAHQLFRAKVHIGFVAAIVAAANAGGAWSVVGDTTTTMMWIAGVSPVAVAECIVAAVVALLIFGVPAAIQQQRYSPLLVHSHSHTRVDFGRVSIVVLTLTLAIAVNVGVNTEFPARAGDFPYLGAAVCLALLISVPLRRPDWELVPRVLRGSIFLLALVVSASLMPVDQLPSPSWQSTLGLGFLSAVFDNIPLTALALKQGGYDWGFLAYAVGFGGSMLWFGSSAGVALCNLFPKARSVGQWLRHGWAIPIAYIVAFFVMLLMVQWHVDKPARSVLMNNGSGPVAIVVQ
ncbi:MAG: citrate transporter [Chthoniobacterales bacterium]